MSFVDRRRGPSIASMVAVIAIHGAVGVALVYGLTVSGVITKPEVFTGVEFRDPPPPPVEPPKQVDDPKPAAKIKPYVPVPPLPLPPVGPTIDATDVLPPPQPPIQPGLGEALTKPTPTPAQSFAPVAAKPRNNPAGWVTTDDYRSNWIRQEMTGRARFRLEIAADGKVTDCTVTASTGHQALDEATCALIAKRARFQPGRGGEGQPVASSYAGSIDWRLPE